MTHVFACSVFFFLLFFLYWPLTTLLITSASTTCRNVHTDALRCIFIQNTCIFFTYICIRSSQDGPSCSPHWQKKKHLQRIYWTDKPTQVKHLEIACYVHYNNVNTISTYRTRFTQCGKLTEAIKKMHCCIKKKDLVNSHLFTLWHLNIILCIQNLYLYVTRDSNICECTATKTGFLCYFHYRHLCAAICLRAWNTTVVKNITHPWLECIFYWATVLTLLFCFLLSSILLI